MGIFKKQKPTISNSKAEAYRAEFKKQLEDVLRRYDSADEYRCDICYWKRPKGKISFHDGQVIQQAIRNGFNPWKCLDMTLVRNIGKATGLSDDDQYQYWCQQVMVDNTRWGLCPSCTDVVQLLTSRLAEDMLQRKRNMPNK